MKPILHALRLIVFFFLFSSISFDISAATITANSSGNWSASAWPNTSRTGTILTATIGSTAVTATGTSLLTQVCVGSILKTTANVVIGTVASINSATSITLTAGATAANSGVFNFQGVGPLDAALIPGGFTVTIDKSGLACASLTIASSGTGNSSILFNSGTQLTVAGNVTVGSGGRMGSITMTAGGILTSRGFIITNAGTWTPGTGTIEFNSVNTLPTTFFAGNFNNLTVSLGTTTTSGTLVIAGNLNIPDGGGGGSILTTSSDISVTGTTTIGGQPSGSASLILSSLASTMNGLVSIGNGGTWDNTTGNSPVTFHGGISNNGDFLSGTGVQTFNTNSQTLSGTLIIPSVTITAVTVTNNSVLTIATALAGSGTLSQGVNATLNLNFIGALGINSMIATSSGNLVNYGAAGLQTVFPTNYYYLTLSNSGFKTLQSGTTTITADFTIRGTASAASVVNLNVGGNLVTTTNASFNTGAFTNSIAGFLNNAGTFTSPSGSTLDVGMDVNNSGIFIAGDASVANITGNVFNTGTFTGGIASFLHVAGNLSNAANLNAGTSTIDFNGATPQTITNSGTGDPYNLSINNTDAGLQLETSITVTNVLDMTQGNIDLNGNNLNIGTSTSNTGGLTYTSGTIFGTGAVERWYDNSPIPDGSQAGLYPVGTTADFRPFFVSTPTGPTVGGSLTLNYNDASTSTAVSIPDGSSTINTLDDLNWNLVSGDGLSGGTYRLGVQGTGYGTVTDVNDLRLSLAGSVVGVAGTNGGTLTDPQVNRTGLTDADLTNTFFFGFSSSTPLPITLLYFKAYPVDDDVKLEWATTSETNNDHFTILRSTSTTSWDIVSQVPGAGSVSTISTYGALDDKPYTGISYYRIRQTDLDGRFTYSPIVSVHMGQFASILIYPNPSTDMLFISTPDSSKLDFQLTNNAGQIMMVPADRSSNNIRLNVSSLPTGVYFLRTLYKGETKSTSVIKK